LINEYIGENYDNENRSIPVGKDPANIVNDEAHVNDLLYGLTNYRGATTDRMDEGGENAPTRTIDEYNKIVGVSGNLINGSLAGVGVYLVRQALEDPSNWKKHLVSKFDYPSNDENITNEQKWMKFLVREKHNIGLWDLGNKKRPVIGKKLGIFPIKGEAEGLTKIKSKNRFSKNMHEDDEGTFSQEDVHKMLSFGTDYEAAKKHFKSLNGAKKQGVNRWIQNAFWRRTSKLGIDFATSDEGLGANVYFNLTSGEKQDDGTWKAKLWGILDDVAADKGTRKITESEWRYVERLMVKDPERLERIIPYSEGPSEPSK